MPHVKDEHRRRSVRHLLGQDAEVHVGPVTVSASVRDVSQHGMGLEFPQDTPIDVGQLIWILVESVASYAITATVIRVEDTGIVGVEFEEILAGEALEIIESLPLSGTDAAVLEEEDPPQAE